MVKGFFMSEIINEVIAVSESILYPVTFTNS